ncbi:LPS assembly lipoprotein LptE [Campylobacter armoricus]|uniref:Lipooligosaccharide transport system, OM translocon component LptE n=1 Tax=Campylobacter armoricus TaxID=2505970 RepID=A0A7L5IBI0_9BACT|nr:LPS assembly lipoprotein LptE [Campylobacter armoricus]QKF79963.1 lipooligosaccharide transport system, OM translocon component LptE [Campylobacter armoricus]
MKKYLVSFFAFFIIACGYIPSSQMASKVLGENVFLKINISKQDPENSVYITDILRETMLNKLGRKITDEYNADSSIIVTMKKLDFHPMVYDKNGYVINYKAQLYLEFILRYKNGKEEIINTRGSYNFDINPNSIISDQARFEAIKNASSEAFDEFVSIIAIRGYR